MNIDTQQSPEIKKTWKPIAAGILNIIAGSYVLFRGVLVFFAFFAGAPGFPSFPPAEIVSAIEFIILIFAFIVILAFTLALSAGAILALIGGYFATQRRRWDLAFPGSIAACLLPLLLLFIRDRLTSPPHPSLLIILSILGIAAIVLVALSKKEFE